MPCGVRILTLFIYLNDVSIGIKDDVTANMDVLTPVSCSGGRGWRHKIPHPRPSCPAQEGKCSFVAQC